MSASTSARGQRWAIVTSASLGLAGVPGGDAGCGPGSIRAWFPASRWATDWREDGFSDLAFDFLIEVKEFFGGLFARAAQVPHRAALGQGFYVRHALRQAVDQMGQAQRV